MSSRIGTLQGTRPERELLPRAAFALLIVITVAAVVTSLGRDDAAERPREATVVSGTAANTPSELRGGMVEAVANTAANTPSELRGGMVEAVAEPVGFVPHVPRRAVGAEAVGSVASGTAANTPSELTGGIAWTPGGPQELSAAERYDLHQRV